MSRQWFLCHDIAREVLEEMPKFCRDIKSIVVTRMEDRRQEEYRNILLLCRNKDQNKWQ